MTARIVERKEIFLHFLLSFSSCRCLCLCFLLWKYVVEVATVNCEKACDPSRRMWERGERKRSVKRNWWCKKFYGHYFLGGREARNKKSLVGQHFMLQFYLRPLSFSVFATAPSSSSSSSSRQKQKLYFIAISAARFYELHSFSFIIPLLE